MPDHEYTLLPVFAGSGGVAIGAQGCEAEVLGQHGSFKVLSGIDICPVACANFEYLTGIKALRANVRALSPQALRDRYGSRAPTVIVGSPPCQGASKLVSDAKAEEDHYVALNELVVVWTRLMFEAWPEGPAVYLIENVPNVVHRAKAALDEVRSILRAHSYVFHDGAHELGEMGFEARDLATLGEAGEFYNAGALGGLAQNRRRWLLGARDPRRVPPMIYTPPARRVRGVGEVLGKLPLPGDPAAGPMHVEPEIAALTWIRLAMIPAGGDHRDIPGVMAEHEKRREHFRRMHVAGWGEPSVVVGGPGTNGPCGVADPRLGCKPFAGAYGVVPWEGPSATVRAMGEIDNSPVAVADPRLHLGESAHTNILAVGGWDDPARTVTGATRPAGGAGSVADPRCGGWFPGALGVVPWEAPSGTVTGRAGSNTGAFSVADPRLVPQAGNPRAHENKYEVRSWDAPAGAVIGATRVGSGAPSVADPRVPGIPGVGLLPLVEAMKMVDGSTAGPWAIVDRRADGAPLLVIHDLRKKLPVPLWILADDGTVHRPLTPLELAVLQGLPARVRGEPLQLRGGGVTQWRRDIGNLIPPPAAQAFLQRVLVGLLSAEAGAFSLSSGGGVWFETPSAGAVQ